MTSETKETKRPVRYEYRVERIVDHKQAFTEETGALQRAGEEGWELVAVFTNETYNVYYFKRLKGE